MKTKYTRKEVRKLMTTCGPVRTSDDYAFRACTSTDVKRIKIEGDIIMSKKVFSNEEIIAGMKDIVAKGVTLRKIALMVNIPYWKIRSAQTKPIPGQIYDPEATNWNQVAELIDDKYADVKKIDWDAVAAESVSVNVVSDMSAFPVGTKVYLRKHDKPFTVIWLTDTHIVILEEGSTAPKAWGHETFIANGPALTTRKAVK